jgi:hypothetical protein
METSALCGIQGPGIPHKNSYSVTVDESALDPLLLEYTSNAKFCQKELYIFLDETC